jgi:uncharacterized Zn finger protein (UPF0148 family)
MFGNPKWTGEMQCPSCERRWDVKRERKARKMKPWKEES